MHVSTFERNNAEIRVGGHDTQTRYDRKSRSTRGPDNVRSNFLVEESRPREVFAYGLQLRAEIAPATNPDHNLFRKTVKLSLAKVDFDAKKPNLSDEKSIQSTDPSCAAVFTHSNNRSGRYPLGARFVSPSKVCEMMRQTTVLSLTAAITIVLGSVAHAAELINWAGNLEEARSRAVQQNKLLLIHFWTPDCGPCKVIDKKVFPTPDVAQTINRHYVPLKINAYQDTALRDHFGVRQWPTDIVATVDGRAVHRMVTSQDPSQYIQTLSSVAMQNRSMLPSQNDQVFQIAQTPQYQTRTEPKWSNAIAPPELTDNSARARRPGVDPSQRPGFEPPLGGAMIPHRTQADSNTRAIPPANNITNQFAANNRFDVRQDQLNVSQAQIRNPYVTPTTASPQGQPPQAHLTQQRRGPHIDAVPPQADSAPQQPPFRLAQQTQVPPSAHLERPPAQPAQPPTFGLDGRCPVTLVTQSKWVKGSPEWGAVHRGHTYLFAGQQEQQAFLANPDDYSPVLAGMDVVALANDGRVVQGNRRYGVLYDDDGNGPRPSRIYLFDSVATRNRFELEPETFVQPVMQAIQQDRLDSLLR